MTKKPMPWSDRFALINHYNPTDVQIRQAFGLSQDELDTARSLLAAGSFRVTKNLDTSKYPNVFDAETLATSTTPSVGAVQRLGQRATVHTRPETAQRRSYVPQKRGRKGNKISNALLSVPTTRIPVEDFIRDHDVSLAVLRQSRRFIERLEPETRASIGVVHVRQDKVSKKLYIWREMPAAE